jgi:ADP-ribose pyrophosphatase YjhB (NUDIX family)
VGVIILKDNQICLIQRAKEPSKGMWTFPGGAVELGEGLHEAAKREALEETGLVVDVGEVATVIDNVIRDDEGSVRYHYVIVDYFARPVGGMMQPGTDVSDVKWASLADVKALNMTEKAQQIACQLLTDLAAQ